MKNIINVIDNGIFFVNDLDFGDRDFYDPEYEEEATQSRESPYPLEVMKTIVEMADAGYGLSTITHRYKKIKYNSQIDR